MSEPMDERPSVTLHDLAARLEDLTREVRRQGRAAVAAQAAAESCLEKLAAPPGEEDDEDDDREPEAAEDAAAAEIDAAWARALIPVADALDRVVAQAAAMAERRPAPSREKGLWAWLRRDGGPPEDGARDAGLAALAEGLRVLRAQMSAALASRGVTVDRRTGVPVDPEVHRVVEVRAPAPGERGETVLEVIRPGYAASGRVVREAEVVAARAEGSGA